MCTVSKLIQYSMNAELDLDVLEGSTSRYSIVTIVFFATYIVCQPPATVICRWLGPRNFLSVIVILWGAVMIGMGFSDSYGTLAALRVVLGVLEAGFFPSCVYLLSTWCTCTTASALLPQNADTFCRHSVRHRQAILMLLHSRQLGLGVRWYSGLRTNAIGRA
jgi:MFS family permease